MQALHCESTNRRRQVNENLVRLQSNRDIDPNVSVHANSNDEDDDAALSQVLPGQQFFQDADAKLKSKTNDEYVKGLISVCNGEVTRLLLYRDHLWERARSSPDCPAGRLMSRKTTNKSSKAEKYARDCYIMHKYTQGERSGEIHEVLGGNPSLNDSVIYANEQHDSQTGLQRTLREPDVVAMLIRIQSDVDTIKHKNDTCEKLLIELTDNLRQVTAVQNQLQITIAEISPSYVCRANSEKISDVSGVINEINDSTQKICEHVVEIRQDINVRNCNLQSQNVDEMVNECVAIENESESLLAKDNETEIVPRVSMLTDSLTVEQNIHEGSALNSSPSYENSHNPVIDIDEDDRTPLSQQSEKTLYSDKVKSNEHTNKADPIIHNNIRTNQKHVHSEQAKPSEGENNGFVAYRRKKKSSFYVGNIDPNVTYNDVVNFMAHKRLKASGINIYYGESSASVKFYLPTDQENIVEREGFWPDELRFRRWKSKADWEDEKRMKFRGRGHNVEKRHANNSEGPDPSNFKASSRSNRPKHHARYRRNYTDNYTHSDIYQADSYYDCDNRNDQIAWGSTHDSWNDDIDSWHQSR